jgi:hypothetical protein
MAKINKVYPSFYNGVTQQSPELTLDNQCKDMVNCVPDLVRGLRKRPPALFTTRRDFATYPEMENAKIFHTYDRGEDEEEYILLETLDKADEPIQIFNKAGQKMIVEYTPENAAAIKDYLLHGNLRGLTVQDRTWVVSKNATVSLDYTTTSPLREKYTEEAFLWLKRGSGDKYNPFNYAVYLDGIAFACDPVRPATDNTNPPVGCENSDFAATLLADKINSATPTPAFKFEIELAASEIKTFEFFIGVGRTLTANPITLSSISSTEARPASSANIFVLSYTYDNDTGILKAVLSNTSFNLNSIFPRPVSVSATANITLTTAVPFVAEARGSVIKITRQGGGDFTFSSWDSWGNQASESWKGSVNKITDLPQDMPFANVYVKITGTSGDDATDYFVKWNGSSWEECLDPAANRGRLVNMPIKLDRTSLVGGVATFLADIVDWSQPRVGNLENNPDPTFVNSKIQDVFFYKNRFGLASTDSVALTETASYTNFYATSVVSQVATDMVDVTIATNQASKIYYVKPFNSSLYIFTKYAQYEMTSEAAFSPTTVVINNVTNYPMAINVEPVVSNDSLYFVSTTNNRQQLREYIKTDKLSVTGIDLNTATPTYLETPITTLVVDGVLGYVLCCTDTKKLYLYNYKSDGEQRIQSAWSSWVLLENLAASDFEYRSLGSSLIVVCKTETDYRYHQLQLDYKVENNNKDTSFGTNYPYESSIVLPTFYPKLTGGVRTPLNKVLLKKVTVEGVGNFSAEVYRKDYNKTFFKTYTTDMKDLDFHVASKVDQVEITIKDGSENDFTITSVVMEGLFTATSQEIN